MKFAIFDGVRQLPVKGLKGICPACGQEVIAKCGNIRAHHWAHSKKMKCLDKWWESETKWHREWKDNYPLEWQEVLFKDPHSGERHRADINTEHGLTIEFQYSSISEEERQSRERFYDNLIWVVNGSRLKGDFSRLLKNLENFKKLRHGCYEVYSPEKVFPEKWVNSGVPVIFDFTPLDHSLDSPHPLRSVLYLLLNGRYNDNAIVYQLPFKVFISLTKLPDFKKKIMPKIVSKRVNQLAAAPSRKSDRYFDPRSGRFKKKRRL